MNFDGFFAPSSSCFSFTIGWFNQVFMAGESDLNFLRFGVEVAAVWSQDLGMFWSQDLELVELV